MTVSPCRADSFVYSKEIYQFLFDAREYCLRNQCEQIASIALEIGQVDPLVVFDKLGESNKLNFYWENRGNREAIAALDSVAKLTISGEERFDEAEVFISDCLKNIIHFPHTNWLDSQPYFFCSFSFFDKIINQVDYPFPPATVFLPRWQVVVKDNRSVLIANTVISAGINIQQILQSLRTQLEIIESQEYYLQKSDSQPRFSKKAVANPDKFKRSVASVLQAIELNQLTKVVLADTLDVRSNTAFSLFQSLNNLRQLHPNCYVFSTSNGKGQNFIGASPERLISVRNQQLITDALAGSAPRGKTLEEDEKNANRLLNSEKERHEHLLVIDFITQRLSELGLLPQMLAPRLRQLSNIQHLWTPIQAIVPNWVHPLRIVAQLHPTPAVAGADRNIACAEIQRYESFERGLYAAPLGWVDGSGNCEFIVGIRSALIDGNSARLYAGAGIVAGSDPDKELAEIQLKLQALLKALV
jgi:menaquinone-specific isochorismate synthase